MTLSERNAPLRTSPSTARVPSRGKAACAAMSTGDVNWLGANAGRCSKKYTTKIANETQAAAAQAHDHQKSAGRVASTSLAARRTLCASAVPRSFTGVGAIEVSLHNLALVARQLLGV